MDSEPSQPQPQPQPEPQPEPNVHLSSKNLVEFLVDRTSDVVSARIRAEEERRFRWFGVITAVIGLIGAGVLNLYVDRTIRDEIESQMEGSKASLLTSVAADVDAKLADRIDGELRYLEFALLASQLDLGTGFTEEEVITVHALLRALGRRPAILQREQFGTWLEKVVDAFAAAGRGDAIDTVVSIEALHPVITRTRGIGVTLMENYARRLIIGVASEEERRALRERFGDGLESIDAQGRNGIVAFFRILVAHSLGDADVGVEIERAGYLPPEERAELLQELGECHEPTSWGSEVTFATTQLAEACKSFQETRLSQLLAVQASAPASLAVDAETAAR